MFAPIRTYQPWGVDETSSTDNGANAYANIRIPEERLVKECRTRAVCVKLERIEWDNSNGQSTSFANPTTNDDFKTTQQVASAKTDGTASNEEPMETGDELVEEKDDATTLEGEPATSHTKPTFLTHSDSPHRYLV